MLEKVNEQPSIDTSFMTVPVSISSDHRNKIKNKAFLSPH